MQNEKQPTLFAFQLATRRDEKAQPAQQWKTRDGVSVAGCTFVDEYNLRASTRTSTDGGVYC